MITVQKDHIRMDIDEGVLSEHERLGWRIADPLPESDAGNEELQAELETLQAENEQLQTKYEQQNKVIVQYENETNALKSALDEAQEKIAELEAKLSEPAADKQPESKTEPKKGKGE
jgi:hypothetical protein|nr:MAG TPA: vimentin [Caudoviricetes sp.]